MKTTNSMQQEVEFWKYWKAWSLQDGIMVFEVTIPIRWQKWK